MCIKIVGTTLSISIEPKANPDKRKSGHEDTKKEIREK